MSALKRKKSNQASNLISQSERFKLVKEIINVYVAQKTAHESAAQEQFSVLICAYWKDMPHDIKLECAEILSTRTDISPDLKSILSSVSIKKTAKPSKNSQKKAELTLEPVELIIDTQNKPHIPVWWTQPELFFDMKFEARIKAISDLAHEDVPEYKLLNLPENELRDFKNFYFAGDEKSVLQALQNSLNISSPIFEMASKDADLLGMCLLFKAFGFDSKDMISLIVFNSAKLKNPAYAAFERAKWIECVPPPVLAKIIHLWQDKSTKNNTESGATLLQKQVENALSSPQNEVEHQKKPPKVQAASPRKAAPAKINKNDVQQKNQEAMAPQKSKISKPQTKSASVDIEAKNTDISTTVKKAYFMKQILVKVGYKF